jgi:hypothetical protein
VASKQKSKQKQKQKTRQKPVQAKQEYVPQAFPLFAVFVSPPDAKRPKVGVVVGWHKTPGRMEPIIVPAGDHLPVNYTWGRDLSAHITGAEALGFFPAAAEAYLVVSEWERKSREEGSGEATARPEAAP